MSMETSLKDKTINSMLWCSLDRIGATAFTFICNLVLARLLFPEEFGCIAMLQVFLAIADAILHGGFGTALIQKKDTTQLDYSSVFYCNLIVSVLIYVLLFFIAPSIANFYGIPLLCKVLRVQGLQIIVAAFTIVQVSILKKQLNFRSLAIRNLLASGSAAIVGIVCALCGLGVWSLVINALFGSSFGVVLLWRFSKWRPTMDFSLNSVLELFSF